MRPPLGLSSRMLSISTQRRTAKTAASLSSGNEAAAAAASDEALAAGSISMSAEAAQLHAVQQNGLKVIEVRGRQIAAWPCKVGPPAW